MVAIEEEKVLKTEPDRAGSSMDTGADENRTCQQPSSSSKETSDVSSGVSDVENADRLTTDVIMDELPSSSKKNDSEDVNETFVTCVDTVDPEESRVATNSSGSVTDKVSGCSEDNSSLADSSHVVDKLKTGTSNNVDSGDVQSALNHGSENVGNTATEAIEVTSGVPSKADETNSNISKSAVVDNQDLDVSMAQDSVESFSSAIDCPSRSLAQGLELSNKTEYDTPNTSISSSKSNLIPESQVKVGRDGTSPSKALISLVGYGESGSDDDMESDEVEEVQDSSSSKAEKKDDAEIIEVPTTSSSVNGQEIAATSSENPETVPVIDLATDNYRYTVDIVSGTDDSESDSDSPSSSSSSSSSNVALSSSSDETSDEEIIVKKIPKDVPQTIEKPNKQGPPSNKKKRNPLLTAGEISIEDLPPIEDLKITVPEEKVRAIGYVFNIVDQQVVVQGHHGIPPIDLDSVLFLDSGKKVLGVVFDVFGHVQEPLYVVRFNSSEHIKEHEIQKGEPVFYAPETEHTSFVVIDELMRIKGSDASGLTGNELAPCEATDFSDDEEEAKAKGSFRQNKFQSSTGEFQPNRKRSRNPGINGRERGPKKDRNGKGGFPNPFSGQGMKSGTYNQSGQRPFMKQKFYQRSSLGGPSHMQGPRFGQYGSRPVAPFPNQFEMPGNMNYDVNARQYHGSPGPNINYHPNTPRPWTPQFPSHQFGCHTPFSNQRPAFPTENNGHMPQPIQTPPPCQMTLGSGTPTPTTVGEYQNFGAAVPSGPSFHSYPVNGTPGPSGFHNYGPPMPPLSPNQQNMAQSYNSYGPQRPHHPPNEFQDMITSPNVDISSPPPPYSPAMNGGWMPPRHVPPYQSPNSLAPPPPPPPSHQHPPTHTMPPPFQQRPPHPSSYDYS